MLPIVQQTEVSACIVDSPRGIQNDFNRRSRVKRRCAEFLISIMGWDRRRKRKYPAVSDKIVTGQRNLIIDPREQGKFLFWRGVNYCYVSENVVKKREFPSTGGGRDVQRVSNKMEMSQGLWRKSVNMLRLRWT